MKNWDTTRRGIGLCMKQRQCKIPSSSIHRGRGGRLRSLSSDYGAHNIIFQFTQLNPDLVFLNSMMRFCSLPSEGKVELPASWELKCTSKYLKIELRGESKVGEYYDK